MEGHMRADELDKFYFPEEEGNQSIKGEGRFHGNGLLWVFGSRSVSRERSSIVSGAVAW